jgi:hypothetical protein
MMTSVKKPLDSGSYESFRKDIEHLINRHCMENRSDTPDFILAKYLTDCLMAYDSAVSAKRLSQEIIDFGADGIGETVHQA